jgi:Glyoxalase-like domain
MLLATHVRLMLRRVPIMACRISEPVVKCRDPQRLAAFWCKVLGFIVLDTDDGAVEIGPREGFGGWQPTLVFSPTKARQWWWPCRPRVSTGVAPGRVHCGTGRLV